MAKVLKIQKFWKAKLAKRHLLGHRISKNYAAKQQLWKHVINHRYQGLQNADTEMLNFSMMMQCEQRNVESYFWRQIVGFSRDLDTKVAKIER